MYINLYISSLAQVIHNPALGGLGGLPGPQFFAQLIPALIGLAFVVGVFAFVFYFLFGAVSWIVAGGDKVAIEVARSRVTHAVVGLTVLLLTFVHQLEVHHHHLQHQLPHLVHLVYLELLSVLLGPLSSRTTISTPLVL